MSMQHGRRPLAERAALPLAAGVICLLVAACESSPGSTSSEDMQGATATAELPSSSRAEASTGARAGGVRLVDEAHADLVLYVSNQSFADSPVVIEVAIDGVVLVDQAFAVEGGHNWFTFPTSLPPGEHMLTATSDTGVATQETIEIPEGERRWAALDYWYSPEGEPRSFTWNVSAEPIGFA